MNIKMDINLIDVNSVFGGKAENNILNKIHKDIFYEFVTKCEIRLEHLFTKTKLCIQDCHNFNLFLRQLKDKYGIQIYESILFMEDFYVKFKKILSMLDGENEYELQQEMSNKHNIKMLNTKLSEFLEFETIVPVQKTSKKTRKSRRNNLTK